MCYYIFLDSTSRADPTPDETPTFNKTKNEKKKNDEEYDKSDENNYH